MPGSELAILVLGYVGEGVCHAVCEGAVQTFGTVGDVEAVELDEMEQIVVAAEVIVGAFGHPESAGVVCGFGVGLEFRAEHHHVGVILPAVPVEFRQFGAVEEFPAGLNVGLGLSGTEMAGVVKSRGEEVGGVAA